jgi:hypothetical protein
MTLRALPERRIDFMLMTLYDKGEVADLSAAEKRLLKAALDAELAQRAARRLSRRR